MGVCGEVQASRFLRGGAWTMGAAAGAEDSEEEGHMQNVAER